MADGRHFENVEM